MSTKADICIDGPKLIVFAVEMQYQCVAMIDPDYGVIERHDDSGFHRCI